MEFTDEEVARLKVVSENRDDAAHYALLLGLKLIESGFDTDGLIRALQVPGTGLDIHLWMQGCRRQGNYREETGFYGHT